MHLSTKAGHFFLFLLLSIGLNAQVKPSSEWSFDRGETNKNKCPLTRIPGISGQAIDLQNNNCLFITSGLPRNKKTGITVEFWFKGDRFQFLSFGHHYFLLQLSMNSLLFRTTHQNNQGKTQNQDLLIPLKGAGRKSYNYYTDQQWHHFVFTVDLEKGVKRIWIDAASPEGFSSTFNKQEQLLLSGDDGFRNSSAIDELRFYPAAISESAIQKRWQMGGKKMPEMASERATGVDPKEFAPGYPNYSVQAKEQLRNFPRPRFYSSVSLPRNMSWMDINFLHRELPSAGGTGFGTSRPNNAVVLMDELAKNWNYYIEIPLLRTTSVAAKKAYANPNHLAGALAQYANAHPQYPTALITVQAQNIPTHIGMDSKLAYLRNQHLPSNYFMKDANGNFILRGNRKIHSPLMPLDIVEKDAAVSANYIKLLMQHLQQPPALINENGEIFGHTIREEYLRKDPAVWKDFKQSGRTAAAYSGRFQFRQDSLYKKTILESLGSPNTKFSFYNLSAIQPGYWPDYAQRRTLNKWTDSIIYPSPDFYPTTPDNWSIGRGALNGFGIISEGRKTEIELGDRFFAPFVSAGWAAEEKNIRPAQWLALLKSMVMLGADFFYTGYFNITGKGGKWPNGAGPNDPRGYIYQAAMPAYAQALRSWAPEFFTFGRLLDPADYADKRYSFRFKGQADNELILVRKWKQQYLIYGSIQPSGNQAGNVPEKKNTSIRLEGKTIQFPIRRQGSIYILDLSAPAPVFYQLDGWHQYEHPYYWSNSLHQDAAVFSYANGAVKRSTKDITEGLNFSNATTTLQLAEAGTVYYDGLSLETGNYKLTAVLKALTPGTRIQCHFPETGVKKQWTLSPKQNDFIQADFRLNKTCNRMEWSILEGSAEINHFSVEKN